MSKTLELDPTIDTRDLGVTATVLRRTWRTLWLKPKPTQTIVDVERKSEVRS